MPQRDDFLEKLRQQLRWLEGAANRYDQGDVDEAILMAVRLRVLLYDPGQANAQSTSLLTHLGVKRTLRLLTTAALMRPDGPIMPALTSISLRLEPPEYIFKPKLDTGDRADFVPVSTWWSGEVTYGLTAEGIHIFRRDIVQWAANKDGGTHIDEELPPEYLFLENGAGWSINLNPDNGPPSTHTFENAHFAAIRQMAHEVLNSPDIQNLARRGEPTPNG